MIALLIAYTLVAFNLLGVAIQMVTHNINFNGYSILQFGIATAVAWCLFRGQNWARWYLVFALPLACVYMVAKVPSLRTVPGFVGSSPFLVFCAAAALTLWRSTSVEAYFTRDTPQKKTMLSIKDEDGVKPRR